MNSDQYQATVVAFVQSTYREFGHDPCLLASAKDAARITCIAIAKAMQTSRQVK